MSAFSTPQQLEQIRIILSRYVRLPFSGDTIPGAVMEAVLAHVRGAERLNTYDFVDVVNRDEHCGWQVKSTKVGTPVTWKRAKIPNARALIEASRKSSAGLQRLGDAIIEFCNAHVQRSLEDYGLNEIGYCRLIVHEDGRVTYFEKLLCTRHKPLLFTPEDFVWRWSTPKRTVRKEQLQALHGIHNPTNKKWWAWHGLGENQLHFSGESAWWPGAGDHHTVTFSLPTEAEKVPLEGLLKLLSRLDAPA
ncbi:MAG: hypothetical protein ACE5JU_19230 [Candidatus Binatia bacterium]